MDTGSRAVREAFARNALDRREAIQQLTRSTGVDLVEVTTDGGHLDALVRFFKLRQRRLRRT